MNILFLARSLQVGGAEVQLAILAKALISRGHQVQVATFYDGGRIAAELISAGIPIVNLKKRGRYDIFGFFFRWLSLVRRSRPQVIYSFLTVPNIISALGKPAYPGSKVVWGIRASQRDLSLYDWTWKFVDRLEARLSKLPNLTICNSMAGLKRTLRRGFKKDAVVFVPNGIDCHRIQFDAKAREALRAEWGLDDHVRAVGMVGRVDPVKRHEIYIDAAKLSREQGCHKVFFAIGSGDPNRQKELEKRADGAVRFLSDRSDMSAVYSALDVTIVCSSSEGFPNVLAESMSCGTPVVSTDVGDARLIVGDLCEVLPVDMTAEELLHQISKTELPTPETRELWAQRIRTQFSVEQLVGRTEEELCKLL